MPGMRGMGGSRAESENRGLRAPDYLLLAIGAAYWPLEIMAVNIVGVVHPERMLAITFLLFTANLLVARALIVAGLSISSAVGACFLVTVIFMSGGALHRELGTALGYVVVVVLAMGSVLLILRLQEDIWMKAAMWAIAIALLVQPAISLVRSWQELGESVVSRPPPINFELSSRPDIFLILLDGYPGRIATGQDDIPPGAVDVRRELTSLGFEVPGSAWSAYWVTELAIPSILDMGYPATQHWDGDSTSRDLYQIISGSNRLHEVLTSNGYQTYQVESGWSGSSCGANIDVCVAASLMDEAMFLTLKNSVVTDAFGHFGGPLVHGALAAMEWLTEEGPRISQSQSADFVFAHVVAPHQPYVLTRNCSIADDPLDSPVARENRAAEAKRHRDGLVEQADCVDKFMIEMANSIDEEDVVIFVSDHGSDLRDQTNENIVDWNREAIVERLNVFVAARLPDGCSMGDELITSNLMLRLLSCLSHSADELNPPRMWINPMDELDSGAVGELMSMRPAH